MGSLMPRPLHPFGPAFGRLADRMGRLMVVALFWYGVVDIAVNFQAFVESLSGRGVPAPAAVAASLLLIEVITPLVLVLPDRGRLSMLVLGTYCALTAAFFHGFWTLPPDAQLDASFRFFKTVALSGALMMTASGRQAGEAAR